VVGWVAEIGELRIVFGRRVTWRITGGVSAFGVLDEADGLVRGLSWVREHEGEGGRVAAVESVSETGSRIRRSRGRADS
jgi:hypothetical protein